MITRYHCCTLLYIIWNDSSNQAPLETQIPSQESLYVSAQGLLCVCLGWPISTKLCLNKSCWDKHWPCTYTKLTSGRPRLMIYTGGCPIILLDPTGHWCQVLQKLFIMVSTMISKYIYMYQQSPNKIVTHHISIPNSPLQLVYKRLFLYSEWH